MEMERRKEGSLPEREGKCAEGRPRSRRLLSQKVEKKFFFLGRKSDRAGKKSLTTTGIVARQPNNFPERGFSQFFWVKDGPTWRIPVPPKKKNGGRRK